MSKASAFLAAVIALAGCGGASGVPASAPQAALRVSSTTSPISHVIIVVQENRSFDNLFDCFKGTDCVKRGKERVLSGTKYVDQWVAITEHDLVPHGKNKTMWLTDIGHCYYSFVLAYDDGNMDGFNREPRGTCPRNTKTSFTPIGAVAYQYVRPSEIAPYWDMAKRYGLADRMFQTQGSGSFSAHQDLIRGGTIVDTSGDSMIDTPSGVPWGCDAISPNTRTNLITPSLQWELDKGPFPCTNKFKLASSQAYKTLGDLLDDAGVGWRYYSPCFKFSPPGSGCKNTCIGPSKCSGALLNAFDVIDRVRNGPEWGTNVSMPQTNIFNDIQNGQLQAVSWVIPTQADSDHPGDEIDDGPSWVASIVNAVGESSYWDSSAVIVVWDDWGGLYDHVNPGTRDAQGGPGFRVPMIVVSPYVPQAEVSHTRYAFGSLLRYVEENWNLGSLGTTDSTSNSIIDMFDYDQAPRPFKAIPSSLPVEHFEREPSPSAPADTE